MTICIFGYNKSITFFTPEAKRNSREALPGDQYFSTSIFLTSKVKQLVARMCSGITTQFGASLVATCETPAASLTP